MKTIAQAPAARRRELFEATAGQKHITPAAAEKDFWIVWALHQLFDHSNWNERLRFKGGTSLSKGYGIIERFSEDIDLILDWRGLTTLDPEAHRSKTQQSKLNQQINREAVQLIDEQLLPDLQHLFAPVCTVERAADDPHSLDLTYPAEFAAGYLRPVVRLEIGPLAAMLPMQHCSVRSFAAEYFPEVFSAAEVKVPTIGAERSFWEKLTILHAEAHRPENKPLPPRYARHYYDVYRMAKTGLAERALAQAELLPHVVTFKQKFYPVAWANYPNATLEEIQLLPAPHHQNSLVRDYQAMQEMIFGHKPGFNDILQTLEQLQNQIHNIKKTEK